MDCPSSVHFVDLAAVQEAEMPQTELFERLSEKLDEMRSSVVTIAVEQAKMAGKLEAMEGQLTALQRTLADVNTLRDNVTRLQEQVLGLKAKELRTWIEKLVAGAIGGGLAAGAQYFLK